MTTEKIIHQPIKKTLGIFSLTCCEGCQFELLNFYDQFTDILNFFEVRNFILAKEENENVRFDVSLVEGTPETKEEMRHLKQIRKMSKILIALGTCAHLGGIQAGRNFRETQVKSKNNVKPISQIIKVDYILPGCPINREEAYQVLLDIYHGRIPYQINYPVCFDCRNNQTKCLLKEGKICLGPITRSGCKAICTHSGYSCLGCRGPVEQTNLYKMREILSVHFPNDEINRYLEIYGEFEKEYAKLKKSK